MKNNSIPWNACVACERAMRDYKERVTTGQTNTGTDGQTDAGQSDPYMPLCFVGETKTIRQRRLCSAHLEAFESIKIFRVKID